MLKSPATRYGCSRSKREDWWEADWGNRGRDLAQPLPIVKRGEFVLKQPCMVKTYNAIKSPISRGKWGSTVKFRRRFCATEQATLGLATRGAKYMKSEKQG